MIQAVGPNGMTNMVSAVDLATIELLGLRRASSERRSGARRIMLFLTDGLPTLPFLSSTKENARMTISKAERAAKLGIRIDTYAIGKQAVKHSKVLIEVANVTNGVFTPVRHPETLSQVLVRETLTINSIEIENATISKKAVVVRHEADAEFYALVPMADGPNEVEIIVHTASGARTSRLLRWPTAPVEAPDAIPDDLKAKRDLLLSELMSGETQPPVGAPSAQ